MDNQRQQAQVSEMYDEEVCFSDISSIHSDSEEEIQSPSETSAPEPQVDLQRVSQVSLLSAGSSESLKVSRQLSAYVISQCENNGSSSTPSSSSSSSRSSSHSMLSGTPTKRITLSYTNLSCADEKNNIISRHDLLKDNGSEHLSISRTSSPSLNSLTHSNDPITSSSHISQLDKSEQSRIVLVANDIDNDDNVFNDSCAAVNIDDISSINSSQESITIHTKLARKISSTAIETCLLSNDEYSAISLNKSSSPKEKLDSQSISPDDTIVEGDSMSVFSEIADTSAIERSDATDTDINTSDSQDVESVSKHTRLARRLSSNIIEACYNSDSTIVSDIESTSKISKSDKQSSTGSIDVSIASVGDASTCESVSKCTRIAKRLSSNIIDVCLDTDSTSISSELESVSKHTRLAKRLSSTAIEACLDTDASITSMNNSSSSDGGGSDKELDGDCNTSSKNGINNVSLSDTKNDSNITKPTDSSSLFLVGDIEYIGKQEKLPGSISTFRKPIDSSSVRGSMDGSDNLDDLNASLINTDLDASSIRISLDDSSMRYEESSNGEYSEDSYVSSSSSSSSSSSNSSSNEVIKSRDISPIHTSIENSVPDADFKDESTIRESIHESSNDQEDVASPQDTSFRISLSNSPFKNEISINASSVLESLDRGEYDFDAIERLTSQLSAELNIKEDDVMESASTDVLSYSDSIRNGITRSGEVSVDVDKSEVETSGVVCKSVSSPLGEVDETQITDYDVVDGKVGDECDNLGTLSNSSSYSNLDSSLKIDQPSNPLKQANYSDIVKSETDSDSDYIQQSNISLERISMSKTNNSKETTIKDYRTEESESNALDDDIEETREYSQHSSDIDSGDSTGEGNSVEDNSYQISEVDDKDNEKEFGNIIDDTCRAQISESSNISINEKLSTGISIAVCPADNLDQSNMVNDTIKKIDEDGSKVTERVYKEENNLLNIEPAVFDKSIEIESKSVISANIDTSISPDFSAPSTNRNIRIYRTLSEELAQTGEIDIQTSPHLSRRPTPDIPCVNEATNMHYEAGDKEDNYPSSIMSQLNPLPVECGSSFTNREVIKSPIGSTQNIQSSSSTTRSSSPTENKTVLPSPIVDDSHEFTGSIQSTNVLEDEEVMITDESSQRLLDAVDLVLENNTKLMG